MGYVAPQLLTPGTKPHNVGPPVLLAVCHKPLPEDNDGRDDQDKRDRSVAHYHEVGMPSPTMLIPLASMLSEHCSFRKPLNEVVQIG